MATKKRAKTSRSAKGRKAGGARRAGARTGAARKKPTRAAKGRAAGSAKKRAAKAAGGASRELTALKARLEREKAASEKRLNETMKEIAQLRHHEARATQLERQLKERDDVIVQLRAQLNDLRHREIVADDEEIQPSLALGAGSSRDLDEFEDDVGPEEDDELI